MRIGLYGMPCSGKSYFLNKLKELTWNRLSVFSGSELLFEKKPEFRSLNQKEKEKIRKNLAKQLRKTDDFIMDGHHSFGEEVVFTEEDGDLYDIFCYLYVDSALLNTRMLISEKNKNYLSYDLETWQNYEISSLRTFCHENNKDFFVLDFPSEKENSDLSTPLSFIKTLEEGYSCVNFAKEQVKILLSHGIPKEVTLSDGDKTLTFVDTSKAILNFKTSIFDGNFYSGYQQWQQFQIFKSENLSKLILESIDKIIFNEEILKKCPQNTVILTSGHCKIWENLSKKVGFCCICGETMCADTKYFITKFLQEAGIKVTAFGDSMNDYFMLKQADSGYLVKKCNGTLSNSLISMDMDGIFYV